MKKLLSIFLALSLVLALAACSGETGETEAADDRPQNTEITQPEAENTETAPETAPDTEPAVTGGVEEAYYSLGLTEEGFFEGVKASDIVRLPDYVGVEYPESLVTASEEAINEQISLILQDYADYEKITDRAIENYDTVNIDYVGSIDGVEFQGGSTQGNGTDVTIGVTQYIDDFLEQLIGHTPGENFDIEVTFPENYGVDNLNGKDAVFNITINYIVGDAILPELTDEIAANYGFDSVEALKGDIAEWLVGEARSAYVDDLLSATECDEVPESVIDYFKTYMRHTYEDYYSTDFAEILAYTGYEDEDAFFEENMATIESMAIRYLAVQAIAEREGLRTSRDDLAAAGLDGYEAVYGLPYLMQYLLSEKIVPAFIMDNGSVAASATE